MSAASWPPPLALRNGLDRLALTFWREREAVFPAFARRDPDALDLASGAWALCREAAKARLHKSAKEGLFK